MVKIQERSNVIDLKHVAAKNHADHYQMVCAFEDYKLLYSDLSKIVLFLDSSKKFRLIEYNKELGESFSKFCL